MDKNRIGRGNRYFSEKFRRDVVTRIENKEFSVLEISRLYAVSATAVYKWIYKYSTLYQRGHRQIIEPMSADKKVKELQARIRELEAIVGQKQIKVDFLEKVIELAGSELGIDIKKKVGSGPSSGSGKTGGR